MEAIKNKPISRFLISFMSRSRKVLVSSVVIIAVTLLLASGLGLVSVIRPPKITSELTPANFDLDYQAVTLKTSDDLNLAAWFVPRQSAGERLNSSTTIILLHGYPADKGNILPLTHFLAKQYNLLYFDFRHLGESEGAYSTLGAKETKDLRAALEYLKREQAQEQFGLWGFSLGGAVALMTAPSEPRIRSVVSVSAFARLSDMAYEAYRLPVFRFPLGWLTNFHARVWLGLDPRTVSPVERVAGYDRPVLLIHSPEDEMISFAHAKALQVALGGNPHLETWFPSGFHGRLPAAEHQRRVSDFFHRWLEE